MAEDVMLSPEGFEKLKRELEELKGAERQKIADNIREAKSHGDLRENAMYHEAKLNQRRLESRIAELERVLQYARVVEIPVGSTSAHLGSTVELEDIQWGDKLVIELVGAFEADPLNGKVSISSPMGGALIDKIGGDILEVVTPSGIQRYKVLVVR